MVTPTKADKREAIVEDVRWIGLALRHRATCEANYVLDRRRRWWYTVKAIVCILLRREDSRRRHTWTDRPDPVEVAYGSWSSTFHPDFGSGAEGTVLQVGWGVRRGWHFSVIWTGYP